MTSIVQEGNAAETPTLTIDLAPPAVGAGSRMVLTGTVTGAAGYDLRGQQLHVLDTEGTRRGEVLFEIYDGQVSQTAGLEIDAPVEPGEYHWLAIMTEATDDDEPREVARVSFGFEVIPHSTSIVVWDVPPAIEVGQKLCLKLGIKSASGIPAAGARFSITREDGEEIATGIIGNDTWPGTDGLHYAEVEFAAPETEGRHAFRVVAGMEEFPLPHKAGSAEFRLNCMPVAKHLVAVTVLNSEDDSPLEGARIQMHPYKGMTDRNGRAEIRVAGGKYTVLASAREFAAGQAEIDVDGNMDQTLRLVPEPTDEEKLWVWA